MLTVVTYKWGKFPAYFVNRMRAMLERTLHIPHELVCVTDSPYGIDLRVRTVPLPQRFADTPRCRRRMPRYSHEFARQIGAKRILSIDLDMVLVNDITPLVDRDDPIVLWRVDYAGVFSGAFQLYDAGVLHELWLEFDRDPEGYPKRAWPRGIGSDQAMLNYYLSQRKMMVPHWSERDGFATFFGDGYERFEHHGVSLSRSRLPHGARVIVFGSDDIPIMESGALSWMKEHWRE